MQHFFLIFNIVHIQYWSQVNLIYKYMYIDLFLSHLLHPWGDVRIHKINAWQ